MRDQHFERANNVAGRDFIQHNYSGEARLLLGPQKWAAKRYVLGTDITSGWLAFVVFLTLIVVGLSQAVSALHDLFTHSPAPDWLPFYLRFVSLAAIALIAALVRQVSSRGFVGIPGTRIGVARDIQRHVFIGQLAGEGSLCPRCNVKLHFHDLGSTPILKCTRNGDHWWPFDFTAVAE